MFTGIITHTAAVSSLRPGSGNLRISLAVEGAFLQNCAIGDSISVSGVCLTAVEIGEQQFSADVSGETLERTTLSEWEVGRRVNLEKSLRLSDRLGGHLVSGHVDTRATLVSNTVAGESRRLEFECPLQYSRFIAAKGSVCLDGVSLTVNEVSGGNQDRFCVNVVPHTLKVTSLGSLEVGEAVNLEVDLIARYLDRLVNERR